LREVAPRFAVEPADGLVPGGVVSGDGFLRTLPHRHGADGFFAARLVATRQPTGSGAWSGSG
jgi:16S rRNA C967 or C1407 C5-methylase (RsmB/RsmF family)